MARRRRKYGLDALKVISAFVDFATDPTRVDKAKEQYAEGLQRFAYDPDRVQLAQVKLATWYKVLGRHRSEIRKVYDQMKYEYDQELNKVLEMKIERELKKAVPVPAEIVTR